MKFQLLMKTKMLKNEDFFSLKLSDVVFIMLINVFFMLINVKMPKVDCILTFMCMINVMLS